MLSGTGWMSRIRISGYKSIRSCDLPLGKTNVLMGPGPREKIARAEKKVPGGKKIAKP